MKAISFLGTGKYNTVTYYWQNKEFKTNLFPEAVAKIFEPKRIFVLITPTVEIQSRGYIEELKKNLGSLVEFVSIPEGKKEDEVWRIFEECSKIVEDGDELLFDITHAFRSIPFIVFAVAIYLRRTKNATIRQIIYGAYEAREPGDRVPIFDLTPLLDLLDWLTGVEFLLRRSDATLISEKLRQIHKTLWRKKVSDELPRKLESFGKILGEFSKALHFSRPLDVMKSATQLLEAIEKVGQEVERWAKPFAAILDQVKGEAKKFAYDEPELLNCENLKKQIELIEHYLEKGLTIQAITLAREWIVSLVALQKSAENWLKRDFREEIEKVLGDAAARIRGEQRYLPEWFSQFQKSEEIAKLWDWLTRLRNDVAHCGMREEALEAEKIEKIAKDIPKRLRGILNYNSRR
ncbi:MAG: TIGR02221 family CRISPR-associated protein [Candidatus Anstonellaceae archaeon]